MQARLSALLLAVLICLTACREQQKPYVVGVSQCSVDNWRDKFNDELRTAALLSDSVTVRIESANDDDREQNQQINKFVDEGIDLLIVSPNQLKTVSSAVERAFDRGIPVILYDRKASSKKYTAFIGCDNHQIGLAMGQHVAQQLEGHGRVVEIRGLQGSSPALERHNGFVEALQGYPGIRLVATEAGDWKEQSGAKAMQEILRQTRDFDFVYAHNDRMAMGARREAERQGLSGRYRFTGVDGLATDGGGLELVRDGLLDASCLYPTRGNEVIALAMNILTGRPYQRENYLQTSLVTRDNAVLSLMEAKDAERQRKNLGVLHKQVDSYMMQFRSQRVLTVVLGLFLLLLVLFVAVIWRNLVVKARLNRQLEEGNDELKRLNKQVLELTHSRLVFFTNISHELRTPLTLITDPVDRLLEDPAIKGRNRDWLTLIKRNAASLQQLVTTILDFRKMQSGKMKLQLRPIDLAATLRQWVGDFALTAERKRIKLHVSTDGFTAETTTTDEEKLSRVVFNLMSNALKYTPQGGDIFVTLADGTDTGSFSLSVRDTGKGIAQEERERVFERFFQSEGAEAGTGVGLAVVKTYTELLGGTVSVGGEEGKGAEFVVSMGQEDPSQALASPSQALTSPSQTSASPSQALTSPSQALTSPSKSPESPSPAPCQEEREEAASPSPSAFNTLTASFSLLIIDDNDDIRHYIRTMLQDKCMVLEASDGQQGLDVARREVPDLVLCDVMMPVMDGLETCRRLKQCVATSHIPVIMLTAKSLDEQRAEGYECGADSYITKPFNSKVLLVRIQNLLQQRALLRQRFAGQQAKEDTLAAETDPRERTFLTHLRDIMAQHLADSDFGVEQLGQEIGLSRVQLYRKVKALTGTSAVDLLRRERLKRARQLLETTHRSIAEVAYEAGFSSPSYFSKCFKEEFGVTPGDFLNA